MLSMCCETIVIQSTLLVHSEQDKDITALDISQDLAQLYAALQTQWTRVNTLQHRPY